MTADHGVVVTGAAAVVVLQLELVLLADPSRLLKQPLAP